MMVYRKEKEKKSDQTSKYSFAKEVPYIPLNLTQLNSSFFTLELHDLYSMKLTDYSVCCFLCHILNQSSHWINYPANPCSYPSHSLRHNREYTGNR